MTVTDEAPDTIAPPEPRATWPRYLAVGATVSAASSAVGSLMGAVTSTDSPVAAVANATIDAVPGPIRRWAIRTFGTSDKLALAVGILVVLALVSAVVARVAERRRQVVLPAILLFAAVGLLAADDVGTGTVVAAIASALTASLVFALLVPPRRGPRAQLAPSSDTVAAEAVTAEPMVTRRWDAPVDRRQFVVRSSALWAGTAMTTAIASSINRTDQVSVASARRKFPRIAAGGPDAAPVVPAGASVDGAVPFITPTDDFYRIDTAFLAPRVTLEDWRLEITGAVDRPLTLTYDDLLDRHVIERVITLCCVSNEVGGDLIGTTRFLGVPFAELLDEVGVRRGGTQVAMTSSDGWTCGFPTEIARDGRDAMIAIGMDGEPLTVEHGFPARMVVPGLYGYVSATKWITRIELTGWDDFDGYWIPRGWSKEGPVKTQSRIDVPANGERLRAGTVAIAGVAWAQHRGIDRVEVRVDDGDWMEATVGDEVSVDAWRQWRIEWDAAPGEHRISVRATDGEGDRQTADPAPPAPDGATGHHTIAVEVA